MSNAPASAASTKQPGFLDRHHFLLRRLHSLTGIVPIGVFVIFHLFTNMQLIWGAIGLEDTFQHEVEFIHDLPALLFLEIFGLWLPIGFHAALGLVYTFTGKTNIDRYKYGGNIRYTLQRVSGILAVVFIFLHIATLRWRWNIFGWYTPFFVEGEVAGETIGLASASTAIAFNGGPESNLLAAGLVILLYIIGVSSVVFHWSNGLWTAAISWGITTTEKAFQRWGYVCAAMGVALAVFGGAAIYGAITYDISPEELQAWETLAAERAGEHVDPAEANLDAAPDASRGARAPSPSKNAGETTAEALAHDQTVPIVH